MSDEKHQPSTVRGAAFVTTQWSVVLRAGGATTPESQVALGELYEIYGYPLYAYIRRKGHSPEEAQDFLHDLFFNLLDRGQLAQVAPRKGRFRSYLIAAVNHLMINEWQKQSRVKRGGGRPLSLDGMTAEERYRVEPMDHRTPEQVYDRRWALTVIDRVFQKLRDPWVAAGKQAMFDGLRGYILGEEMAGFSEVGESLGLSEGAARIAVHRLRQQYRQLLRDEISQTVDGAAEIDEELHHLIGALRS